MRYAALVLFFSLLPGWWTSTAWADQRADVRVIVLRSNAPDAAITDRVDRALVASLAEDAGFGRAELSPVLLSDLGLAAGCDDRSRRCLNRIAGTVDADVVVVRDLQISEDRPILALTSFDSLGAGAPIYMERTIEREPNEEVSEMVRQLYALDDHDAARDVVVLPPRPVRSETDGGADSGGVSAVTWVTLGAGAAAIGAGAVLGALSADAHELYARTPIHSDAQADRAQARLETAQDRALAANIFFGAGGALLAIGATLLVLDLTSDDDDGERLSLSASAAADGGVLVLRGATEAW